MKNKSLLFASFIFMIFASCDSSSIDESEPAATSLSATSQKIISTTSQKISGKIVERDISNSIVATDTPTGSTFVGTMTHLGEIRGVTTTSSFVPNGDGTFNFASINDVIIAANGDEVYTNTNLVLTFRSQLEATYVGGFIITGGTGRFVGATGYLSISNGVYIINGTTGIGTSRHNAVGKIKY